MSYLAQPIVGATGEVGLELPHRPPRTWNPSVSAEPREPSGPASDCFPSPCDRASPADVVPPLPGQLHRHESAPSALSASAWSAPRGFLRRDASDLRWQQPRWWNALTALTTRIRLTAFARDLAEGEAEESEQELGAVKMGEPWDWRKEFEEEELASQQVAGGSALLGLGLGGLTGAIGASGGSGGASGPPGRRKSSWRDLAEALAEASRKVQEEVREFRSRGGAAGDFFRVGSWLALAGAGGGEADEWVKRVGCQAAVVALLKASMELITRTVTTAPPATAATDATAATGSSRASDAHATAPETAPGTAPATAAVPDAPATARLTRRRSSSSYSSSGCSEEEEEDGWGEAEEDGEEGREMGRVRERAGEREGWGSGEGGEKEGQGRGAGIGDGRGGGRGADAGGSDASTWVLFSLARLCEPLESFMRYELAQQKEREGREQQGGGEADGGGMDGWFWGRAYPGAFEALLTMLTVLHRYAITAAIQDVQLSAKASGLDDGLPHPHAALSPTATSASLVPHGASAAALVAGAARLADSDMALFLLLFQIIGAVRFFAPPETVGCAAFSVLLEDQLRHLFDHLLRAADIDDVYRHAVRAGLRAEFLSHFGQRAGGHLNFRVLPGERRFWVQLVERQLRAALVREKIFEEWGEGEGEWRGGGEGGFKSLKAELAVFGFFVALGRATRLFLQSEGASEADEGLATLLTHFEGAIIFTFPQLDNISKYQGLVEVLREEPAWLPLLPPLSSKRHPDLEPSSLSPRSAQRQWHRQRRRRRRAVLVGKEVCGIGSGTGSGGGGVERCWWVRRCAACGRGIGSGTQAGCCSSLTREPLLLWPRGVNVAAAAAGAAAAAAAAAGDTPLHPSACTAGAMPGWIYQPSSFMVLLGLCLEPSSKHHVAAEVPGVLVPSSDSDSSNEAERRLEGSRAVEMGEMEEVEREAREREEARRRLEKELRGLKVMERELKALNQDFLSVDEIVERLMRVVEAESAGLKGDAPSHSHSHSHSHSRAHSHSHAHSHSRSAAGKAAVLARGGEDTAAAREGAGEGAGEMVEGERSKGEGEAGEGGRGGGDEGIGARSGGGDTSGPTSAEKHAAHLVAAGAGGGKRKAAGAGTSERLALVRVEWERLVRVREEIRALERRLKTKAAVQEERVRRQQVREEGVKAGGGAWSRGEASSERKVGGGGSGGGPATSAAPTAAGAAAGAAAGTSAAASPSMERETPTQTSPPKAPSIFDRLFDSSSWTLPSSASTSSAAAGGGSAAAAAAAAAAAGGVAPAGAAAAGGAAAAAAPGDTWSVGGGRGGRDGSSSGGLDEWEGSDVTSRAGEGERQEKSVIDQSLEHIREGGADAWRGTQLLSTDVAVAMKMLQRAALGQPLTDREAKVLKRTLTDVASVIPIGVLMLIPMTPVGHAAVLAAIQRYAPHLFPSSYNEDRLDAARRLEQVRSFASLRNAAAAAAATATASSSHSPSRAATPGGTGLAGMISAAVAGATNAGSAAAGRSPHAVPPLSASAAAAILAREAQPEAIVRVPKQPEEVESPPGTPPNEVELNDGEEGQAMKVMKRTALLDAECSLQQLD
ncbi:unnamed protein product [Closterium sp. NIES-54]